MTLSASNTISVICRPLGGTRCSCKCAPLRVPKKSARAQLIGPIEATARLIRYSYIPNRMGAGHGSLFDNGRSSLIVDLRRLEYFVILAEELHFRRAAERLHISQPGLSQQIRVLEKELGALLFERSTAGVTLTASGDALLTEGKALLSEVERVSAHVRAAGEGRAGIFRIVHSRSLTDDIPDELVRDFRLSNPNVEILVETAWTTRNLAMLRAGEVDAAFVRMPLSDIDDLRQLTLGQSELAAAIPADHPLARQRTLRTADLVGQPVVTFPREQAPGYFDYIHSLVWGQEAPFVAAVEPDPEYMLAAVKAGKGVSVFDARRALRLRPKGVVVRRFKPSLSAGFGLVWNPHRISPLLSSFLAAASRLNPHDR